MKMGANQCLAGTQVFSFFLFIQTLMKMGATNALPNFKFRPCAASAGEGGGLPGRAFEGAGEWECEFVQRAPTYGTEGNLATHIVSVKVLDGVTGRMPLQVSVEPVSVYYCKLALNRYLYVVAS